MPNRTSLPTLSAGSGPQPPSTPDASGATDTPPNVEGEPQADRTAEEVFGSEDSPKMGVEFSPERIQQMKDETYESMKVAIDELRRDEPEVVDEAAAAVGSILGGRAAFTALYFAGVTGLVGAEITSRLAAAVAVPAAALGAIWYANSKKRWYANSKKRRNAELAAALKRANEKLYAIQEQLMANAEHFAEEVAELKAWITELENQRLRVQP